MPCTAEAVQAEAVEGRDPAQEQKDEAEAEVDAASDGPVGHAGEEGGHGGQFRWSERV
ncbi:hypothetical protein [Methylobacterium ajmalii]|uniref:hypothetical protein n=1 Tax=Methylobacterium ajmalii TaxID=2738439 RepID=UPI002FEE14A4